MQSRREWHDIFEVLKRKNLQRGILDPATLLFRIERKIKNFKDKQKLKEFITTTLALQEMLKELLQAIKIRL